MNKFYATDVDIFVNLETGVAFNGWPLGLEAALQGCVLITTDSRNQKPHYEHANRSILTCTTISEFADTIHKLFHNRVLMESTKASFRIFASKYLSYTVQQQSVINFIEQIHQINTSPVITHLTTSLAKQSRQNKSLTSSQKAITEQVTQLQDQINKHHTYIAHLEDTIRKKNEHIQNLEELVAQHSSSTHSETNTPAHSFRHWWNLFIHRIKH